MIALDSNVLIRIAVLDDAEQVARARKLVETAEAEGTRLLIAPIVLAELVWAMDRSYKRPKSDIAGFLERVLRVRTFEIIDRDVVTTAVIDYAASKADFADHLIAAYAEKAGATKVYSFDKDGQTAGLFTPLPS